MEVNTAKQVNFELELEEILDELLNASRNKNARQSFLEITQNLKPKTCITKIGWKSGAYIDFTCKFQKAGQGEVLKELIKE